MDEGHAFDSRLAALRERGFEVVAPTGDLASQEMLYIEEQIELASRIKSMVLDLPDHWDEQKQTFLTRLINPLEAASVEIELRQLLRQHRPWVLLAERVRGKWSEEGRTVELSRILERLDAVDDEIVMDFPQILSMIENVSSMRNIEVVVAEIELRNSERMQALQGMIQTLGERGWDVSNLNRGSIYARFDEADRIRILDEILSRCQRKIENGIRPFDGDCANSLHDAVTRAQGLANLDALIDVEKEVDKVESDLLQRMDLVNERLLSWVNEGVKVPVNLPLLPNEMVVWESRVPMIVEQVESLRVVQDKIEYYLVQWPEYRTLAERSFGDLGSLDSLDVLLQGLISKTDDVKVNCTLYLDKWAEFGIDTTQWVPLIDKEPRAVLEELESHQPFIDLVIPLIKKLQELDTSIDGSERVEEWLADLRHSSAGMAQIEVVNDWLELASNRRSRHRSFLDDARRDLATLWPVEIDPKSLNLAEYERVITELETYGEMVSEDRPPRSESKSRLNQLLDGLNDEFDEWRSLGWSVDGLIEMLAQDPVKLGLDLPGIRGAMASHESRVSRFSRLPWALDTGLAERVLSELRRPECLIGLDNEFQALVHTLANAEGDGDSNFQFTPFVPSNPVSTIEKPLPVLVPVIEEVAHEVEEIEIVAEETSEEDFSAPLEFEDSEIIDSDEGSISEKEEIRQEVLKGGSDSLRRLIGVGETESWEELFSPPLDVRVQRLIRLALLLEGTESNDLNKRLARIAKRLEEWTAERLSRRHASSGNGLLKDAKELGMRLADIPGPGAVLPLSKDEYPLPKSSDLRGIEDAIHRLEKAVILPSAMVPMAPSIES